MDHAETDTPAEVADNTSSDTPSPSPTASAGDAGSASATERPTSAPADEAPSGEAGGPSGSKRRRGSRGGQRRRGGGSGAAGSSDDSADDSAEGGADTADDAQSSDAASRDRNDVELPEPMREGRPSAEAAEKALVRKPRIGDTMPIPSSPPPGPARANASAESGAKSGGEKRRLGRLIRAFVGHRRRSRSGRCGWPAVVEGRRWWGRRQEGPPRSWPRQGPEHGRAARRCHARAAPRS